MFFGNKCINKNAFNKNKRATSIDKIDTNRIVLSKKELYVKKSSLKYSIGYMSETNAFLIPLT